MILKIGHRGARGYEPENTLLSFQKALELHVDMIELDVRICKTGETVVIHDQRVDRTTDGKGLVARKTLDELRTLDAGRGQNIPTLQEVLDFVERKAGINIELKGRGTARPVSDILEKNVGGGRWSYDDFLISSFHRDELQKFSQLHQNIRIGILIDRKPAGFLRFAKTVDAHSVNAPVRLVTKDFVRRVHEKGLKVFAWTVNDYRDIERMKSLKVDGIFSDYPDRI